LFKITKAAITPGTQPQSHNKNTIIIDPQPLSITAKGGHKMESKTRQKLILFILLPLNFQKFKGVLIDEIYL